MSKQSLIKGVTLLKVHNSVFKRCDFKNCLSSVTQLHHIPPSHYVQKRCVSTAVRKENPKQSPLVTKEERLQFDNVFPDVVHDLLNNELFRNISEVTSRFARSLKYNVPNGKKNRGLAVVASYKILEKPENLTAENLRLANILGWSVEMLQGFLLVMDDLTDGSETRRGELCWYKHNDIGLTAINDGLLLENAVYLLLKKYFSHHPSYVHFIDLYHDTTVATIVGQIMDVNTLNVRSLTMDRYELIAKNKTAYYTFYLPVSLALYLSNHTNPETHRLAKVILLEMGKFFQIQDDYLDCFGDPNITGKIGTDIETGKCSWLAVKCMQIASPDQKKVMEENYGKEDPRNVRIIKDLYLELNMPKLYEQYEEESYIRIQRLVRDLPDSIPSELFDKIISTIYKRVC